MSAAVGQEPPGTSTDVSSMVTVAAPAAGGSRVSLRTVWCGPSRLIVQILHDLDDDFEKRAFLRMVATETERVSSGMELYSLPPLGVGMLSRMGPEGRAVLQELDATDAVKNPRARARLQELKANGWKPDGPRGF